MFLQKEEEKLKCNVGDEDISKPQSELVQSSTHMRARGKSQLLFPAEFELAALLIPPHELPTT